jgi:selenocysteine-specific elongation factor
MNRLVVGTAGHIDHGKSALVKALTGTDPDRLKEEKLRGITTDIGFASLELPGGEVSFIDVPGHERFVKNMLAGAHGIDLALLVVAADEGVKPQTVEHLDILRLLGISDLLIVVSKLDLADEARAAAVANRVREIARGTPFADAPHLALSAKSGAGLEAMKNFLAEKLRRRELANGQSTPGVSKRRDEAGPPQLFRLPVDRAFTIAGAGTVVTGTATGGVIKAGDELAIYPAATPGIGAGRVRVRSIETHGAAAECSSPGARTALNLAAQAGTKLEGLRRGAILAQPGTLAEGEVFTVWLTLLASAPPLKDLTQVNLHHLAAEFTGRVRLLTGKTALAPGGSGWAQLWLDAPRPVSVSDRIVFRRISPPLTWGGALLLAVSAKATRAGAPAAIEPPGKHGFPLESALRHALQSAGFIAPEALAARLGRHPGEVKLALAVLQASGKVIALGEDFALPEVAAARGRAVVAALLKLHDKFPDAERFTREQLSGGLDHAGLLAELARRGEIVMDGGRLKLPGRGPAVDPAFAKRRTEIIKLFADAGLAGPDPGKLFLTPADKRLYEELLKSGELIRIRHDLAVSAAAAANLKEFLLAFRRSGKPLTVGDLKAGLNVSRKWAVPLLEYTDSRHWTLRTGDTRKIMIES